jgi:glycosyltransferase involved in cell wall biosynthesis
MTNPISFIIPAYNCGATIAETIASITNGNLSDNDEIVVVNDGSTDDTVPVLSNIVAKNLAVRLVEHNRNRGGAAARNTAVENSRHDLIYCLDSDNLLVPGSVARLKAFLLAERADVAVFRELHYFQQSRDQPTHKWRFVAGPISLADALAGGTFPGMSGNYLYTRASWLKAGGYPEFAGALDAWGFGIRQVATQQRMMVMDDGFYLHRFGHDSYWVRDSRTGRISLTALQILIPFLDMINPNDVDYMMGPNALTMDGDKMPNRYERMLLRLRLFLGHLRSAR